MTEVPELWWSKSAAEARGNVAGGVLVRGHDGRPEHALPPYESELLDAWPADVVPFVPAESRVECPRCRLLRWTVDGVMAHHEAWVGQACPGVGMKPERPVELEARVDPAAERAAEPLLAEPVDEKGRGPTYWRGHADGQLAERSGADPRADRDERYTSHVAVCTDPRHRHPQAPDPPPFAPELADAPLVTGDFGR